MNEATQILEPFVGQWAVLLTTYKRDGTPVGTAVNIAVEGDRAYFRTWDTAWKLRRIRNNPRVQFAPPRPVANRRRHRYGPAPGCWKVKIRPMQEDCSPASILPCTASLSHWSIASGATRRCTSS